MKLDELEAQCRRSLAIGSSSILLVIPRSRPPKSEAIRVKGLGTGMMVNVKVVNDKYEIAAYFNAKTILNTIEKERRRDREDPSREDQSRS